MYRVLLAPLAMFAIATASLSARADTIMFNTSLASPPGLYFGSGNSNSGFTVDTAGNVEIGLSAITRFVGPITPTGDVYNVPAGTSIHGGSKWGVTFSINLQNGGGATTLSQVDAVLTVTDTGTGFSESIPQFYTGLASNTCYGSSGVDAACSSPSDFGIQNSEPGSLFAAIGDTGFNDQTNDTYDITLSVYGCTEPTSCTANLLASDSIQINVVPEPGTLALFGTALAGLGLLYRRRHSRTVAAS